MRIEMPAFILKSLLLFLRLLRNALDFSVNVIYSHFYYGKKEKLPPIVNPLILAPALTLAEKIRKRQMSSSEVVKAYIKRIKDVQPIINAMVDDRFVEAVEDAKLADELIASGTKSEEELANEIPLLGVPLTVKEAIAVKGCLFTVGLAARKGLRAHTDSEAVSLLKKAGAIPIAVTNTSELCFWWEAYNVLYGRSRNPYDTARTVGGSSGGEGCILGSGASVIGIGNDIGGSIRIPACFNGIFGHKPSRGIVSNQGQYPTAAPALQAFLMTGPMCRYATDLLPMLKILAGNKIEKLKLDEPVSLKNMKIYYMENDGGNPLVSSVHPEITKAQREVLQHFYTTYGIKPEKVNLPNMKHSFEMWARVLTTSDMQPITVEMTGRTGEANLLTEAVKWMFGISDHIFPVICSAALNKALAYSDPKHSAKYYEMSSKLQQQLEDLLGNDGIFIYPTNPDPAPYHGEPLFKAFNVGYTAVFNLLGFPISQCPVGLTTYGLPLGLQIVGGLYNDRLTIAVAEELEKVFGGWASPSAIICD